jgi:hydrogenase/urease accessory protein HupE
MPCFNHAGIGDTTRFMRSFSYPIGTVDHILAMIFVSL